MHGIEYLFSENFIEKSKTNYDIVIIESQLKPEGHNIQSEIIHHLNHSKNILIILDISSIDYILPITQNSNCNISIINPNMGLLGFSEKGFFDIGDIYKAIGFGYEVFEPFYQEDLINIIDIPKGKKYIRINKHTPFFDEIPKPQYVENNDMIISLQNYGFCGNNGTILTLGNTSIGIIHAGVKLQEAGKSMDIFVSKNANLLFSKEIKESILRTEKIFFVMDQFNKTLYEKYIKSQLWDLGIFNTEINFICPEYSSFKSINEEYIYEEAKFDGKSIADRIIGLL